MNSDELLKVLKNTYQSECFVSPDAKLHMIGLLLGCESTPFQNTRPVEPLPVSSLVINHDSTPVSSLVISPMKEEAKVYKDSLVLETTDGHSYKDSLILETTDGHSYKDSLILETTDGHFYKDSLVLEKETITKSFLDKTTDTKKETDAKYYYAVLSLLDDDPTSTSPSPLEKKPDVKTYEAIHAFLEKEKKREN